MSHNSILFTLHKVILSTGKYLIIMIIAQSFNSRIQVNDQIIEVDGISLVGVTQQFAAQTLKNTSGIVR